MSKSRERPKGPSRPSQHPCLLFRRLGDSNAKVKALCCLLHTPILSIGGMTTGVRCNLLTPPTVILPTFHPPWVLLVGVVSLRGGVQVGEGYMIGRGWRHPPPRPSTALPPLLLWVTPEGLFGVACRESCPGSFLRSKASLKGGGSGPTTGGDPASRFFCP